MSVDRTDKDGGKGLILDLFFRIDVFQGLPYLLSSNRKDDTVGKCSLFQP